MRLRLLLLLAGIICGCRNEPSRFAVEPLADGEWIVLDRSERGALLMLNHTRVPTVRILTDRLAPVVTDTFSLHVGDRIIPFLRIAGGVFYLTMPGGPRLERSPADPLIYAFEHEDAIWLFRAPATIRKLTLDDDLDVLRAQQREGEVILYFAVNPVWSADGKFISFLSNREAVRAGTRGQSIWLIDVAGGGQRPLYDESGASAHVDAVLGDAFVLTSSAAAGVFGVRPRDASVTRLGDGYVMAGHPAGQAVLLNDDGRLVLLRAASRDTLPAPPAARIWSTHASFSPSAARIALFSTDQAGGYWLHVFDGGHELGEPFAMPAPPASGPTWVTEESLIFATAERGKPRTFRATLR